LQTAREIETMMVVTSQRETLLLLFPLYYIKQKNRKEIMRPL